MLLQGSRTAGELGVSAVEWDEEELGDLAPAGYRKALAGGIELVDVLAGSPAIDLVASATPVAGLAPRFCVRVVPRPTLGLGAVLGRSLVRKWCLLGPLSSAAAKLGVDTVEILILQHDGRGELRFPFWVYDAAADAYRQGLCNQVGVGQASLSLPAVLRAKEALSKRGVPLSCVVVSLSLVDRRAVDLAEECRRLGIQTFAQQALGFRELASGRLTAEDPTGGELSVPRFTLAQLLAARPLHAALASVASVAGQRLEKKIDTAQVAIQWVRSKGASPLVGAATPAGAGALLGCAGWGLDEEEVAELDAAALKVARHRAIRGLHR